MLPREGRPFINTRLKQEPHACPRRHVRYAGYRPQFHCSGPRGHRDIGGCLHPERPPASHLCHSSASRPPQETLQLFLVQRLGGLWGRWAAFAFRRLVLLWPELVAREQGRPCITLAFRPLAIEKDLRWLLRAVGSGSLSTRCTGVQDTTARQHRSCKLSTWEIKENLFHLCCPGHGANAGPATHLSALLSGTLGQDVPPCAHVQ